MRLKDRVAIVTGSGSGIGKAIAFSLASEGAKVVLAARNLNRLKESEKEITQKGLIAKSVQTDISDANQVKGMVKFAVDNFGTVDILVNNAACLGNIGTAVWDTTEDQWQDSMSINIKGTLLCSRECLKIMMPRKSGSIINISSIAGISGLPNESPYTVTKRGVIGMTEIMAIEAGKYNIRVNCVSPGATLTDDFRKIMEGLSQKTGIPYDTIIKKIASYNSLKKVAAPSEIAGAVVFLASDDASAVTGNNIVASCGFHAQDPLAALFNPE
jgi:NAD(P)-dependent dehydrogenase (short-subunit alcohol dehydrogenase family)